MPEDDSTHSQRGLFAYECPDDHLTYPSHPVCPKCGQPQTTTVDLTERTAEVRSWTTVTTTPPGVREPNTLALVEFSIGERAVRMLGGVTTEDISVGDAVRPVYVEQLRDPEQSLRETRSQRWDGVRFEPL